MPEWLIERGIGETRAVLVEDGGIVEARIELDGAVPVGSVVRARLTAIGKSGITYQTWRWASTMSVRFKEPAHSSTVTSTKPIETS